MFDHLRHRPRFPIAHALAERKLHEAGCLPGRCYDATGSELVEVEMTDLERTDAERRLREWNRTSGGTDDVLLRR